MNIPQAALTALQQGTSSPQQFRIAKLSNNLQYTDNHDGSATLAVVTAPVWTAATLNTNWVNYGSPYSPVRYTKDSTGIVRLQGLVQKSVAVVDGDQILTLPAGYRPSIQLIFSVPNAGGLNRLDVTTAGAVLVYGANNGGGAPATNDPPSASWTSLSSISFPADQ